MILLSETSHRQLIQRCRGQEPGQDREAHLGTTWQVGEGQGGNREPRDHLHFRNPKNETETERPDGQNENKEPCKSQGRNMFQRQRDSQGQMPQKSNDDQAKEGTWPL